MPSLNQNRFKLVEVKLKLVEVKLQQTGLGF